MSKAEADDISPFVSLFSLFLSFSLSLSFSLFSFSLPICIIHLSLSKVFVRLLLLCPVFFPSFCFSSPLYVFLFLSLALSLSLSSFGCTFSLNTFLFLVRVFSLFLHVLLNLSQSTFLVYSLSNSTNLYIITS